MNESENSKQFSPKIEQLAMQVARNRANITKWDPNLVIFLFAILATLIILTSQGVGLGIVAPLAVFGLAMAWLVGWKQGRQLCQRFLTARLGLMPLF